MNGDGPNLGRLQSRVSAFYLTATDELQVHVADDLTAEESIAVLAPLMERAASAPDFNPTSFMAALMAATSTTGEETPQ